jgi:hypothetical protein
MEEGENYSDISSKSSKFNGAISQIFRLDELWRDTHNHSRKGQLELWNWDLDRVWVELAGDFDDEHDNNANFNLINQEISTMKDNFAKRKLDGATFANNYYAILNKKELFLRRLQNKLGKGTEFEDEDDILE